MQKTFLVILSIAVISFMSMGCMTASVWEDPSKISNTYNERINAFMMNPQNDSVIFLGEKYHYIFEKNEQLSFLLKHRNNEALTFSIKNGSYNVVGSNVTAKFHIYINQNTADKNLLDWWYANKKGTDVVGTEISLYGTRYIANEIVNFSAENFSQKIDIKVITRLPSKSNTASKILITPLAVAADGAIIIVAVGATIVLMPILIVVQAVK